MAGRGTELDAHRIKIRIQTHVMAPFPREARRTTHDSRSLSPPLSPITKHDRMSKVLVSRGMLTVRACLLHEHTDASRTVLRYQPGVWLLES